MMSTKPSFSEPSIGELENKATEATQAIETSDIGDVSNKSRDTLSFEGLKPYDEHRSSPLSSGDFVSTEKSNHDDDDDDKPIGSDEIDYLVNGGDYEDYPNAKPVEVTYEISDDVRTDSENVLDDLCCDPSPDWKDSSKEKSPDPLPETDDPKPQKEDVGCEMCRHKIQALKRIMCGDKNDDRDLEEYIKYCDHHCREEDEEEVDDQLFKRWLENKMSFGGDALNSDDNDAGGSVDVKTTNDRDDDDDDESEPNAQLWFQEDSSFEFISQVSRLIQTEDSYLLSSHPLTKETNPETEFPDFDAPLPADDSSATEKHESDVEAEDGSGSEDDDPIDSNCIETEMNENIEQLLDSIHHIPPLKSGDGSCNMWMFPAHDENGNCMNVVLDDGEVYDIFVFRPGGPAATAATQTEENEFCEVEAV